jgi:tetratricopeptide (TPR) repeat protein
MPASADLEQRLRHAREQNKLDEVAELLEQLAKTEADPKEKCVRLLAAARVALDALGDTLRAKQDLEAALTIDPAHVDAIAMLERIARAEGAWSSLTTILEQRAKTATGEAREALVQELVTIYKEMLGDDEGAARVVERLR